MARILLVRHAPMPETGIRLTGRMAGHSLGPEGRAAAQRAAAALEGVKFRAVYASPMERTLETAAIIAEPHGLTPIIDEGMVEIDFGSWTGRTLKSLRRTALWETVQRVPSRVRFPEGESFVEAQERAVAAVEAIAESTGKGTAAIVSHSDVIKLVVSYYLGQPIDSFQRMMISTTSISDLRLSPGRAPFVVGINGTEVRS